MDQLANKTAHGSAQWRKERSGTRMGLVGFGLLFLSFPLWHARDFIPTLATKRVMAVALVSTLHDGADLQLQRSFAAAKRSSPEEATLEPNRNPSLHGRPTYYLSVTADTLPRARAGLRTFTDALRAAFPSSENNLEVIPDYATLPAPNQLSRLISFGTQAAVLLLILGGQFLMVVGAHREGTGRARIFAALATPFIILVHSVFFPADSDDILADFHYAISKGEWKFLLLLLALTPASVILTLWLTRGPRPAAGQRRRA